jgi:isopentenyl-diphosphate Delta-isomerase
MMNKNVFHDLKGEQKDQLLITVDQKGNRIGTATREACHKGKGKEHLAFMAFVITTDNKIILTKRSMKKSLWRGFWDAGTISHILSGETSQISANRRGKEELGADIQFKDVGSFYYFIKHGDECENEYCHVLIGKTDKEIDPNPIEIEDVKYVTYKQLRSEINTNPKQFTPWFLLAMEKIEIEKYIV